MTEAGSWKREEGRGKREEGRWKTGDRRPENDKRLETSDFRQEMGTVSQVVKPNEPTIRELRTDKPFSEPITDKPFSEQSPGNISKQLLKLLQAITIKPLFFYIWEKIIRVEEVA